MLPSPALKVLDGLGADLDVGPGGVVGYPARAYGAAIGMMQDQVGGLGLPESV